MKELADCHIAIVGLGLMGGSLAGALRDRCRMVTGIARRDETVNQAMKLQLIDRGTTEAEAALGEADIVVLATPVRTILRQIREIGPQLADGCLLIDLGSTKQQILKAMDDLPPYVQTLGAHPMCGKDLSGLNAADPALYQGSTFILSPIDRTTSAALDLARDLVRAIGATPLILDGPRQDRLVATLSHLPYLLACSLVQTADSTTSADPAAWEIVAGGFRDTTRVAGSDVTMMLDILATNRSAVLDAANAFRNNFDQLAALLESEDEAGLSNVLTSCRNERRRMFP